MDLRLTPAEIEFRDGVRDWLASTLPQLPDAPDHNDIVGRRDYDMQWQRRLYDGGFAGINWPKEFGGRGASPTEQLIFLEECSRFGAPEAPSTFVGIQHAGPTLIMEASAEQNAYHLPGILRGDHVWCQGFSEPGAGSDLASLSTRAIRDGDDYVVTGQKIWTSMANIADYCELLVRTDTEAPKHRGITWVICPMNLKGIDPRPIKTIHGASEFCEVFFDEVRVPVANRVGAENDGWRVAMVTFSFERGTGFVGMLLRSMQELNEFAAICKRVTSGRATAWDDAEIRREVGQLQAEYDALWALTKRNVSQAARTGMVGPGGSVFKLHFSNVQRRFGELTHRVLQRMTLTLEDGEHDVMSTRVRAFTLSIAAGTSQIQRNIVGERVLGLPKER